MSAGVLNHCNVMVKSLHPKTLLGLTLSCELTVLTSLLVSRTAHNSSLGIVNFFKGVTLDFTMIKSVVIVASVYVVRKYTAPP